MATFNTQVNSLRSYQGEKVELDFQIERQARQTLLSGLGTREKEESDRAVWGLLAR